MHRPDPPFRRIAFTGLVLLAVLLGACTRSATTNNLPTATLSGDGLVTGGDSNATMAAIGTEVSAQLTATAVAVTGGDQPTPAPPTAEAGGAEATPDPGASPLPPEATATTIVVVPGVTPTAPVAAGAPCPNPYIVQQGDWIYKIARNCGVSPQAIIAANPGIDPNRISPGQSLNMPTGGTTAPPSGACTGTHTVVTGDTLYRLARNCGLTTEQLAAANNIPYPYIIYVGQAIRYP
jgi:LysM repeat protein